MHGAEGRPAPVLDAIPAANLPTPANLPNLNAKSAAAGPLRRPGDYELLAKAEQTESERRAGGGGAKERPPGMQGQNRGNEG